MSEKSDDYEVEVFVKHNKIIVVGKIRPIHLYFKKLGNEQETICSISEKNTATSIGRR